MGSQFSTGRVARSEETAQRRSQYPWAGCIQVDANTSGRPVGQVFGRRPGGGAQSDQQGRRLDYDADHEINLLHYPARPHEARSCRCDMRYLPSRPLGGNPMKPWKVSRHVFRHGMHLEWLTVRNVCRIVPLQHSPILDRARPLTARADHHAAMVHRCLFLPIRAERRRRDGHIPSRRGTTASVNATDQVEGPHRRSSESLLNWPLDNRKTGGSDGVEVRL